MITLEECTPGRPVWLLNYRRPGMNALYVRRATETLVVEGVVEKVWGKDRVRIESANNRRLWSTIPGLYNREDVFAHKHFAMQAALQELEDRKLLTLLALQDIDADIASLQAALKEVP